MPDWDVERGSVAVMVVSAMYVSQVFCGCQLVTLNNMSIIIVSRSVYCLVKAVLGFEYLTDRELVVIDHRINTVSQNLVLIMVLIAE